MASARLYIGLMSGTSIDAVDAVLLAVEPTGFQVRASYSHSIPDSLRKDILTLCTPGGDHLDLLGATDQAVAHLFADTALALMERQGLTARQLQAIGSHGQTVRHRPDLSTARPFTLQIGDANVIAARTGVTTVADFRRKDMARGGQGAPLAPAFHQAAFAHPRHNRAVVNLGGIANVTCLPAGGPVTGFDTGPANGLMDAWCQRHQGRPYDDNGAWAASGSADDALLEALLAHPFLAQPPPKSTGREAFNLDWLDTVLGHRPSLDPTHVQATLARFSAITVARGLAQTGLTFDEVLVCGGGARNGYLMDLLGQEIGTTVTTTDSRGIDPLHVEGAAFAWIAHRTLARQPGALASVTGAAEDSILGGIYYP